MTDTQEGMLEENYAEFMQWFCAAPTEEILSPIAVWGAATAQSAEKIARLEEYTDSLRTKLAEMEQRHLQDRQKLAAAELSKRQLQDMARGILYSGDESGDCGCEFCQKARQMLARPISTEALDAYVAEKIPAIDLTGLRKAVNFLDVCKASENASSTGAYKDAREWLESEARELIATLPPAPDKE